MKCQNCGKNEVNFHYSSNVNGTVTETNLCSECAMQSGYDIESLFDLGSIFEDMLSIQGPVQSPMQGPFGRLGSISGFMPLAIPIVNSGSMMPPAARPRFGPAHQGQGAEQGCDCRTGKRAEKNVEVDENMSKLRELNVQMRIAVEKEEFERAAELRDQIKELRAIATGENR